MTNKSIETLLSKLDSIEVPSTIEGIASYKAAVSEAVKLHLNPYVLDTLCSCSSGFFNEDPHPCPYEKDKICVCCKQCTYDCSLSVFDVDEQDEDCCVSCGNKANTPHSCQSIGAIHDNSKLCNCCDFCTKHCEG